MLCSKCGSELREGAVFCAKCGSKVEVASENDSTLVEETQLDGGAGAEELERASVQEDSVEEFEGSGNLAKPETRDAELVPSTALAGTEEDEPTKKGNKKAVVAIVAAIIVIAAIVAGYFVFNYVQEQNRLAEEARIAAEQEAAAQAAIDAIDEARLKQDIESNAGVMAGVASTDYVDKDAYKVSKFALKDKSVDEDTMTLTFDMDMKNKFFEEKVDGAKAIYRLDGDEWIIDKVDLGGKATVTPLRGISKSSVGAVSEEESNYDAKAKTCSVDVAYNEEKWFGTITGTVTEKYRFDKTAWVLDSTEGEKKVSGLEKLAGSFYDPREKDESSSKYHKFEIKDINSDTGEATVDVEWWSEDYSYVGLMRTHDEEGGTLSGTIKVSDEGAVTMVYGTFGSHPEPIQGAVTFNEDGTISVMAKVYTEIPRDKKDPFTDWYYTTITDPMTGTVTLTRR